MNAYDSVPCNVDIYDKNNIYVGRSNGFRLRATHKSVGAIQIKKTNGDEVWYYGKVTNSLGFWKLLDTI